jgi:uncharacterized membrane-anchored protein YhcB (DUF1043 family)
MEKFIVGLLIGIIAGMVLIALAIRGITNQRAIELNYAGYNVKTGDFEWYNKDVKYLVTGEKDK